MVGAALFETSRLDASALAAALRSGILSVIGEQQTLNRINVFPVADGDTGTNLSASLGAVLDILGDARPGHAGELLVGLADWRRTRRAQWTRQHCRQPAGVDRSRGEIGVEPQLSIGK